MSPRSSMSPACCAAAPLGGGTSFPICSRSKAWRPDEAARPLIRPFGPPSPARGRREAPPLPLGGEDWGEDLPRQESFQDPFPMTDTLVSSATKEVVIGFERRFVMIGERINPTGRKMLAAEMAAGDYSRVVAEALAQVEAGALMLDVNAGIPLADEPRILAECIKLVQATVDVPLSIDSSIVEALEAGLAAYKGKPLVNSVTGEEERLERVLPLVKEYGARLGAISNDETGISEDPDARYEVAKKIVERAADFGIPREDIIVDPLVMPVGAINDAGLRLTHLLRRLREELKVNTSCGASNFSFGL